LQDVPDVASVAVSNESSVVCPDASCASVDTTGGVFDVDAEVALGTCGVLAVTLVSCTTSNTSVVVCLNA